MRRENRLKILSFFFAFVFLPVVAQAVPYEDLQNARTPFLTKIASWGIKAKLPLIKTDLFGDSLRFKAGFDYNVEPSFNGRYFSRFDTYYFNPSLVYDDVVMDDESSSLNLAAAADYNVEINFVRQFEQAKDALIAWPYFIENLPLTPERAIKNLQQGDFVSFKSKMIVTLTADALRGIDGLEKFPVKAGATYAVSGLFQLHVLRLEGSKIRVKLVASRTKQAGLFAKIGYGEDIEALGIRLFDRAIERAIDLNVLTAYLNPFGSNTMVMSEYDLDLANPVIADVFTKTVNQAARFTAIKEAKLLLSESALQTHLIVDMAELEEAYANPELKATKAISRRFKGNIDSTFSSFHFKLGNRLAKLIMDRDYTRMKIRVEKEDRSLAYYVFDSFLSRDDKSVLAGFRREQDDFRFNGLFNADEKFKNLNLERVVISYDQRDKLMNSPEFMKRKSQIDRTLYSVFPLGPDQYDFSNWWPDRKRRNVAARTSVNFLAEGLLSIPTMSKTEIKLRLKSFLEAMPKQGIVGAPRDIGSEADDNAFIAFLKSLSLGTISQMHAPLINDITNKLHKTFNHSLPVETRVDEFFSLRSNQLFHWVGPGFMLALLDKQKATENIGVKFTMESSEGDKAFAQFGDVAESDIYANLLKISKLIRDDSLDLLLESEEIKGGHSGPM